MYSHIRKTHKFISTPCRSSKCVQRANSNTLDKKNQKRRRKTDDNVPTRSQARNNLIPDQHLKPFINPSNHPVHITTFPHLQTLLIRQHESTCNPRPPKSFSDTQQPLLSGFCAISAGVIRTALLTALWVMVEISRILCSEGYCASRMGFVLLSLV